VGGPKKQLCDLTAILRHPAGRLCGKVTGGGRVAIWPGPDIMPGRSKLSFVSRHLRIHSDGPQRRLGGGMFLDRV